MSYTVYSARGKVANRVGYPATVERETTQFITLTWKDDDELLQRCRFSKKTQHEVGIRYMGQKYYRVSSRVTIDSSLAYHKE